MYHRNHNKVNQLPPHSWENKEARLGREFRSLVEGAPEVGTQSESAIEGSGGQRKPLGSAASWLVLESQSGYDEAGLESMGGKPPQVEPNIAGE